MAKRPTIGNNPLDALISESHLDTVVPDLVTRPQAQAPPKPAAEESPQAQAENQALREEVARLQEQVKELQERLAQAEPRWVTLRRLGQG